MSLRIATVTPPAGVRARFAAAAAHEPLCALGAPARAELDAALAGACVLEDLPGKWQAALLAAEAVAAGATVPATGCGCGGGSGAGSA